MEQLIQQLALLAGGSLGSGVNLYLTAAGFGIAHRLGWMALPGDLTILANPLVIGAAVIIYAIEFVADKIPFIDNAWDTVHTFIRPSGGVALGYLATTDLGPVVQAITGLLTGSLALDAHLTKATNRVAVNATPVPFGNVAVSIAEDAAVVGVIYFIIKHPIITLLIVIAFIAFSIWFLRTMFHLIKKIFTRHKKEPQVSTE